VLIDEFGKDYGNYFSILTLIASSKTARADMESIMEMNIGGFLDRLENEFHIIEKVRPLLSKPAVRSVKYKINDNFLNFWFRFIYKYRGAVEMRKFEYVKNIIQRDYTTYSGKILERYFIEKLASTENLSGIGSYWENGNQNE
jgi:AAA+ ATPase superfamily predicted ATPase